MKFLRDHWKRILKYGIFSFLGGVLLVVIINAWVVLQTNSRIFDDVAKIPAAKVALLLGTSRNTATGPNVFFFQRIHSAAALYHAGKVQKIIVSGDNCKDDYNETEAMRRELVKLGVPDAAIVNDHAGFRTLDSVVRAKSVFDQDEVIIVSQRFHLQRALFIADAKGIKASGYVASDPLHGMPYYKVIVREWFARVKAVMDCYLLGTKPKFPGPKEPIVF
ncbi:MAG TPA: ElyC/SanA/YdcF family protein [Bacteroidia bacterium]|nr:ElyC/SanA/YdcF family protein [Bacteroidia bacterium]